MEKCVVYYNLRFRDNFLFMFYYLINNHIEVDVLNQGQGTRQAAAMQISATGS